eukprot:362265-Chlamydomonas_euryale.AAC.12
MPACPARPGACMPCQACCLYALRLHAQCLPPGTHASMSRVALQPKSPDPACLPCPLVRRRYRRRRWCVATRPSRLSRSDSRPVSPPHPPL